MYYIGYVLSSMGNGDYTPKSLGWEFYAGFISFTGVVFVSLGISFLLPVIEAVALKRQVSLRIFNIGTNPTEILKKYHKERLPDLLSVIENLEESILKLAQYHLAYPVIHYFHSCNSIESLPLNIVKLDEILSILLANQNTTKQQEWQIERTRKALTYYFSTLQNSFIAPDDDEPERPSKENTPEEIFDQLNNEFFITESQIYRR